MSKQKSKPQRPARASDAPHGERAPHTRALGDAHAGRTERLDAREVEARIREADAAERSGAVTRGSEDWMEGEGARTLMIPAQRAPATPMSEVRQPPEIELVQHELPEDVSLDARLVLAREPDSERAAAFRVLRHHVQDHGAPQVVAVTSPRERQGKTTCAVNLALALAECGRARVLLVDGNRRRPELAGMFRFVPPWCFSEQLSAHRKQPLLPWTVVEIPGRWLHVLAINPRAEPAQLLDGPAFGIALERLRLATYDHIVIDGPSVIGSADVNLIQDAADAVLFTALARESTARELRQAVDQLAPSKVIGTTLFDR